MKGALNHKMVAFHTVYPNRWLHSDMKDVSYFYNFMFYYKLKTKGNIQ